MEAAPPRYRRFLRSLLLFIKILSPPLVGSHQLFSIMPLKTTRAVRGIGGECQCIRADMPA
ncbi:hypothetical protein ABIF86_008276 [Bradyrhizobium japonicum]